MFVHTVIMVIEPHMKQGRQHKLISTIFLATSVTKKLDHNKRYEKQRMKAAKLYAKSKHQREDILHKLSCTLTDTYDLIAIEDMSAMKQALRFGKAVSDNG